jgi:hypothetical protein
MTEGERRQELKNFAMTLFKNEKNHCQVLVDIYAKATGLARSITPIIPQEIGLMGDRRPTIHRWARGRNVTNALVGDLAAVLIGTDMREGRGQGPYFAGNIAGAAGFKPELRDRWNQIQHTTAGVVIGYRHGKIGEWFARLLEDEKQDDLLYEASCPVGIWLSENPEDFLKLPEKIRQAIGDNTCLKPQPILQWSPAMLKNPPPTPSLWERETRRPQ